MNKKKNISMKCSNKEEEIKKKENASAGNRTRVQRLEGVDAATIPLMQNSTTSAGFEPAPRYQE